MSYLPIRRIFTDFFKELVIKVKNLEYLCSFLEIIGFAE